MAALKKIGSFLPIFLVVVASICAVTQVVLSKDVSSLESTHGRDLGAEEFPKFTPDEMAYKVSSSIVIMATIIVIFSVCMEKFVMEPLKEEEEENLKPIINTMFSELTLLGFVGLFMFIVEKLDLLSAPSYHIFRDKETLAELFEDVHMVVFLVMVLFLMNAFCLLKMGRATQRRWHEANLMCQGEKKREIISEYANKLRDGKPIPEELDFRLSFMALRERFTMAQEREEAKRAAAIEEKMKDDACEAAAGSKTQDGTTEKKKRVVKKKSAVPHDFDLAHYFGKRMGDKSGEIIEVPVATWFCLEIFLVVLWALQLPLDSFQFSMLFIGVGYLMMFLSYMIDCHLKTVLGQLIPPIHYKKCSLAAELPAGTDPAAVEITSLKIDAKFTALSVDNDKLHIPPFELCTAADIVAQHGSIKRFLFGDVPSKQEHLFFGGVMGEEILTTCIRLEALGSAIYIAIFFVMMLNPILEKLQGRTALLGAVLVLAFVPVVVNFFALSVMISDFTVVTSVEEMKDTKDIQIVKRAMVTKKAMTALKLLNTMRNSLPSLETDGGAKKTPEEVWPDKETYDQKRIDMKEMFDLFDTSGDGSIDDLEFNSILTMMKIGDSPEDRKRIYKELDEDGEGGISFEEFFHWIASHSHSEAEEMDEERLEEMSKQLFDMIDLPDPETGEKDGEISPAEFYATVSTLARGKADMSLTLEDVEAMFKGVDEDGDGMLDAEEFENMLKKYMFDD